jgi:prepilin-type N-terminal cleavage/methylation domain-containing protein
MQARRSAAVTHGNSFTLVEMLVAMAVFSIMLLGIATMLNYVAAGWLAGVNSADNYTTARTLLTVLDRDVQRMALRRDLAAFATNNVPTFAFYTSDQGYTLGAANNTRTLSLVQYSLATSTTGSYLQRLNYGMDYLTNASGIGTNSPAFGSSTISCTNLVALTNATVVANAPLENVASGVIAFQWQFIDGTGSILTPPYTMTSLPVYWQGTSAPYSLSSAPPNTYTSPPPSGTTPFWFDYVYPNASYNPRMLVVSIVVVSNPAFIILQQNSIYLTTLLSDFPTTLPSGQQNQTFAQYWNGLLNAGGFGSGLPAQLRTPGAIKVFERHIPLPISP